MRCMLPWCPSFPKRISWYDNLHRLTCKNIISFNFCYLPAFIHIAYEKVKISLYGGENESVLCVHSRQQCHEADTGEDAEECDDQDNTQVPKRYLPTDYGWVVCRIVKGIPHLQ